VHNVDLDYVALDIRFRWIKAIGGGIGRLIIERSRSPNEIVGLLNKGAVLPDTPESQRDLVCEALCHLPERSYDITRRTGWHGGCFFTKRRTCGTRDRGLRLTTRGLQQAAFPAQGYERTAVSDRPSSLKASFSKAP
jgi:hypothetical protein